MSDQKPLTLAEQYKGEIETLEKAIADALVDFTDRTGFVVKEIQPFFHDYRSSGKEPYYAIALRVDL